MNLELSVRAAASFLHRLNLPLSSNPPSLSMLALASLFPALFEIQDLLLCRGLSVRQEIRPAPGQSGPGRGTARSRRKPTPRERPHQSPSPLNDHPSPSRPPHPLPHPSHQPLCPSRPPYHPSTPSPVRPGTSFRSRRYAYTRPTDLSVLGPTSVVLTRNSPSYSPFFCPRKARDCDQQER